ncbi:MAG: ATP-binding protein [Deltaproteobacteria bacterium]|jgi:SpoVK/Ycf46/Vps4 family AAA+-type ATPase|nr:ATP-binding protein [Deltaproteobacteria bacterium]
MEHYATSLQHILAELERIDLLIQVQVGRTRQMHMTDSEFQGLCISEQEIDALLKQPIGLPRWASALSPSSRTEVQTAFDQMASDIGRRKTESAKQGVTLRFETLERLFHLTSFDVDILLVCMAPELDLRYERLYAYLQDDVTKKRPSVDLVLNLLCPSFQAKLAARDRFSSESPLFKYYLLHFFDDPSHQNPPLLSKYLRVDERVVNYLLGSDEIDTCLQTCARLSVPHTCLDDLFLPPDVKHRLVLLSQKKLVKDDGLIFYFQGPYGVGKQSTGEAVCRELGMGLLAVDGEHLLNVQGLDFSKAVRLTAREVLLQGAALYFKGFDGLLADDKQASLEALVQALEDRPGLTFLAGSSTWEPMDALHNTAFVRIEFSHLRYAEQEQLWVSSLDGNPLLTSNVDLSDLVNKFHFSGGQIRDAAATARNLARWRDPENGHVTMTDLYSACRLQSNRKLATLAQKITPRYRLDDIVLPGDRLRQLREICNYVKYRSLVYDEWGFERKLSLGKGLNVLFTGLSGTGKTMAAEIMAGELGLDLYKIDLSQVVSKYIGETEKNLSRIFKEAEASNAILFFDEADALFGKRSEVKDAHDRYANIEIGYLLQKMEEYEGMTILATNLRQNMDEAFVRRMQFIVDFPFPDELHRHKIWKVHFPKEVPCSDDIDLEFLARQFRLAGGNIRNIVLNASFLAAANDKRICMKHLIHATMREFQKMGKLCVKGDFGKYYELLEVGAKA